MTMLSTIRSAVQKRSQYNRLVRELRALPTGLAVEDLALYPGDAEAIATRSIYGR
ncbi:hypothetical protein [Roseisalinus antarcticus]|uniref:DUF1127 domain-containing protein n=1 Tax=Roseisalinus antarcticus TaxID=254357 RepID=A0A1Y5RFV2_9RHOB|nr:hypothetical protein [Roseisalinus antarcticus]SLN16538.1 hypothetical protein ROA7023_00300 [Roseisalinus antarcticus]